ncbi:MAG: DUF120 domain-containing protein [Acidimicrobiia bacterium]
MSDRVEYTGHVQEGQGLGVERMANSVVLRRIQEQAGFSIVPGTLNVNMAQPFIRPSSTIYIPSRELSAEWEEQTGQAGYFLVPVTVGGQYRGIAMQADEPDYPPGLVELMSEVHLRSALDLVDDSLIRFTTP